MEIQICPPNNSVSLGNEFLTTDVDLSSIPDTVQMIYWYTDTNTGRIHYNEKAEVDGFAKLPDDITNFGEYQYLLDEAQNQRYASENPKIYYQTTTIQIEGVTYPVGKMLIFREYPQPDTPPEGLTDVEPPVVIEDYAVDSKLQWNGVGWNYTPVPLGSSLENAKGIIRNELQSQVSKLINNQLRTYNLIELSNADVNTLEPADRYIHGINTMTEYIDEIKKKIVSRLELLESTTELSVLYDIECDVEEYTL